MSRPRAIARLKITLADVEPKVVRRIDVPLNIRLDRLHLVVQATMPWTDSHLYEFAAGGTGWGVSDPDGLHDGPLPASKTTLKDVLEDTGARTIHYIYDYGDHWDHVIKVERIGEADPLLRYPFLITTTGRCPPEDVGGSTGYAEFLAAIADPGHEEHETMIRWAGGTFDPDAAPVEAIDSALERLAKRWSPKPRKPRPS